MAHFDNNKHHSCETCGFEAIYISVEDKFIAYVNKADNSLDFDTDEADPTIKKSDYLEGSGVYCNFISCGLKQNIEVSR